MKETFVYHGHSIVLELCDIARAGIRWTYFIDGRYCSQGATDESSGDAVRASALALAQRSIDLLDAMCVGALASRASRSCLVAAMMDHGSQRFAAGP